MKIQQAYGAGRFGLSFELFPPKTSQGKVNLFRHVERLSSFRPSYMTCTYGAGGSTQDATLEIVSRVYQEFDLPVATHLTCVGRTTDQLREYLSEARARGIENVVALRGDPPQGVDTFRPVDGGLSYANELVALIRSDFPEFGIAVGGYPETHQEAPSRAVDLENLKRKVDSGANVVITQLFYDNQDFFRFRDQCSEVGIGVPIVPGLLPVLAFGQIQRIVSLCGARLPGELVRDLQAAGDDQQSQREIGVAFAVRQVEALLEAGIPGLHFYVLNRSEAVEQVLRAVPLPGR